MKMFMIQSAKPLVGWAKDDLECRLHLHDDPWLSDKLADDTRPHIKSNPIPQGGNNSSSASGPAAPCHKNLAESMQNVVYIALHYVYFVQLVALY